MGQYYNIITRTADNRTTVYDLSIKGDGEYVMAKLLEHSWWKNRTCRALAFSIVNRPTRVCWVGDDAEPEECQELGFDYEEVWGENNNAQSIEPAPEEYELEQFPYLVNHDKNQFVDLKKYKAASTVDGWCIFPISLLTALGNGRGGGDYHKDDPLVGSWAFDTISLTDQPVTGMEEIEPVFTE